MKVEEAKILLGFPLTSHPHPSQVKAAYLKKVWESHPDRFPFDQKLSAESKFKSISEAYSCLESGGDVNGQPYSRTGSVYTNTRVVKKGVPRTYGFAKRGNPWLIGTPFLFIVLGTIGLGGFKAKRNKRSLLIILSFLDSASTYMLSVYCVYCQPLASETFEYVSPTIKELLEAVPNPLLSSNWIRPAHTHHTVLPIVARQNNCFPLTHESFLYPLLKSIFPMVERIYLFCCYLVKMVKLFTLFIDSVKSSSPPLSIAIYISR